MAEQRINTDPIAASIDSVKKQTWKDRFRRNFRTFLLIVFLVLAFCIYWFFFNSYSKGERTGVLIKISYKGNIFKTNEGEMWLSCRQMTNPEKFYFSVKSDSIATLLKNLQDQCVQLSYTQYRASLPWRGDTRYIITSVTKVHADGAQ
jgi:amino acid transporter